MKISTTSISIISYFFVLLFVYAAVSKILDFENFQVQIAQSPLLSSYAGITSYAVIIAELLICISLILPKYRLYGLYSSLGLMTSFTTYIYLIIHYSEFIPCSCGGILEKLDWNEHLIFNIGCIIIAIIGIFLSLKLRQRILTTSLWIISLIILSFSLVMILFFSSEQMIKKNNNFIRRFPHHPILQDKSLDLKANSYYFAGTSNGKVILGNYISPLTITEIDSTFTTFTQHTLTLDYYDHQFKSLTLYIRDSHFYLADGSVPVIYRGNLNNLSAKTLSYKKMYFDQLQILDSTHIAFRTFNPNIKVRSLGILQSISGNYHLNNNIIKKQKDGLFDTDGQLIADSYTNTYYYIYFYRNKIITIKTPDNSFSEQNTIDTTHIAKVQSTILSNGKTKMTAPPVVVNKMATACKGILFNRSNLMGNYENRDQWKTNAIIDMYNTRNKSYSGSFYIQNRSNHKMSGMLATSKYFYSLMSNEIVRYRYAQTITDDFKKGEAENLRSE
ncbi:tellurium resistance protein TerC [Chryseobacterium sp. G0162]|uniref:MauE/DoxX family redox-associated membrane protein n=1 Tax=Chryseobacterium sp. G0162 TaxID=2487063 RepID=UPI000F4EACF1|nr:MauE/DoxX family redox-associated membrane protein [Chryseobacterium sp. G0162]AZB11633.1 tellurium resistance protein TerC [Chryseobacterium sp. G0162]